MNRRFVDISIYLENDVATVGHRKMPNLGGSATTRDMATAVSDRLETSFA